MRVIRLPGCTYQSVGFIVYLARKLIAQFPGHATQCGTLKLQYSSHPISSHHLALIKTGIPVLEEIISSSFWTKKKFVEIAPYLSQFVPLCCWIQPQQLGLKASQ